MRALISGLVIAMVSSNTHAAPPAPPACAGADFRAFDFWLGDWLVHKPDGKLAGHNKITREYGGCVLHEHYTTEHGYSGESLNIYDASRKVWHQSWVDNTGLLLMLEGGIRDGAMVLEGQTLGADGQTTKQRITWTPNKDGSVRQLWEATNAKGEWAVSFDGLYTRKP
jgi:hypothetical protein